MNPAVIKMKLLAIDILANGVAWTGVITGWREDIDYWLKIIVGVSAVILSWVTIYVRLKGDKSNKDK